MTDPDKLAELKRKYGGSVGDAFHDEGFKRIAEKIFTGDTRQKPYAGIPTFIDAPYRPDALEAEEPGIDVALIGVPTDLGVTNRGGARFGPRAVRTVERIGPYHHGLDMAPLTKGRFADIGDVPFRSRYDLVQTNEDIETFYRKVVGRGLIPLSVGGDHSISYPILKALGEKGSVGMIHIDAHCDTAGPFEGQKFHHGGPFRSAVLDGVLDPERTIQIGIRGGAGYLWEFSYESGMTVVPAEDIGTKGIDAIVDMARRTVGEGPTYLSFDVDSLDPAFAPGTGTPEVGGLSTREAIMLLNGLQGLNFIGGDVVEVAPSYDPTTNTAQAAAQILFHILCLIVSRD